MSHKYRAAIGRESPGPASRGILLSLSRGKQVKSVFCGKNPGFAADRKMPAVLLAGKGFLSSVNAAGIPVGCQAFDKKGAADSSADILSQILGTVWPRGRMRHPPRECPRPPPFGQSPKRGQKRFLIPGTRRKIPAAFFDGAESIGGKILFSSCRLSAKDSFLR